MDFGNVLATLEKYAVDYIRYVLSITGRHAFRRRARDIDAKLVTFAFFSAALGVYLWESYIQHAPIVQSDLLADVFTEFSIWIGMSVIAYAGVSVGRRIPTPFTAALAAVLRVLPVGFVLSAYAGFAVEILARFQFSSACAGWWAFAGAILTRLFLLLAYLPLSLSMMDLHHAASAPSSRRALLVAGAIAVATLLIQGGKVLDQLTTQADGLAHPFMVALATPYGSAERQAAAAKATDPAIKTCLLSTQCGVGGAGLTHRLVSEQMRGIGSCFRW